MSDLPTPINRNEQFLNGIATGDPSDLPTPITREEQYLDYIAKNGGGSGGAGVSSFNGRTGAVVPKAEDYTAEQVGALPADTSIPSKTSDLTNDSGFIAESSFDSVPTQNSTHGVQSGGVYSAEKAISDNILALEENGAKNILSYPYYETTKTENGITFTVNSDGSITVNGTASADVYFMCRESYENIRLPKNGITYILNGCPSGGGASTYSLYVNYKTDDNTWKGASYDYGDGCEVPYSYSGGSSGGIYYSGIEIKSGVTVNNLTFKPMIRDARITDPTYTPYAMTNRELTESVMDISDALGFTFSSGFYAESDIHPKITQVGKLCFISGIFKCHPALSADTEYKVATLSVTAKQTVNCIGRFGTIFINKNSNKLKYTPKQSVADYSAEIVNLFFVKS